MPRLATMTTAERATLPGVSDGRRRSCWPARWSPRRAMDLFGVDALEICPWALREGVILRRLDHLR